MAELRGAAASHQKHPVDQGSAPPPSRQHTDRTRVGASLATQPAHTVPLRDTDVEMTGMSRTAAGGDL